VRQRCQLIEWKVENIAKREAATAVREVCTSEKKYLQNPFHLRSHHFPQNQNIWFFPDFYGTTSISVPPK